MYFKAEITNLTNQKTPTITVTEIKQDILGVYFSPKRWLR